MGSGGESPRFLFGVILRRKIKHKFYKELDYLLWKRKNKLVPHTILVDVTTYIYYVAY